MSWSTATTDHRNAIEAQSYQKDGRYVPMQGGWRGNPKLRGMLPYSEHPWSDYQRTLILNETWMYPKPRYW